MSFGEDNFIGLCFFDALHIEAKSNCEEMTGELSLYPHLTVAEVLGSYDYQKCLVYEAFQITFTLLCVSVRCHEGCEGGYGGSSRGVNFHGLSGSFVQLSTTTNRDARS